MTFVLPLRPMSPLIEAAAAMSSSPVPGARQGAPATHTRVLGLSDDP